MSDQSQPKTSGTLQIPADTQAKFGNYIELIKGSESMNDEERQYWINILPIMTPDQLKNLEEILHTEKEQLAAIDAKYAKQMNAGSASIAVDVIEQKIKSQKEKRLKAEQEAAKQEDSSEEILSKIQAL